MTRVRSFLSCDFNPHRPVTGYIFHGFLAFRFTGCIRRVYYKHIHNDRWKSSWKVCCLHDLRKT